MNISTVTSDLIAKVSTCTVIDIPVIFVSVLPSVQCSHTTNNTCSHAQPCIQFQGCWGSNFLMPLHSHRVESREVLLTPLQATDQGGTITMVTASGRSFTRQIDTEDIALQETNPATPGQLVLGNWSIIKLYNASFYGTTVTQVTMRIRLLSCCQTRLNIVCV